MEKKKDLLEQYVVENRKGFDDQDVPPMLWNSIEEKLDALQPKKQRRIMPYIWRAAAAILIFASAWYLNDYMDSKPGSKTNAPAQSASIPNPALSELSDAEAYYTSQINSRQAELIKYTREHPEIMEDLKREFRELDQNNVELKRDLAESNADEKVIEAIIQSYRVKLGILEEMLTELQKTKGELPEKSVSL